MRRFMQLTALSLFILIFCSVAAVIKNDNSISDDKCEEPLSHTLDSYYQHLEMRASHLRNRSPAFRTGEKKSAAEVPPPESKDNSCEVKRRTKKQDPAMAESPPSRVKLPPAGLLPGENEESIHFLLIGRWWEEPAAEVIMMVTLVPGGCARLLALDPAIRVKCEGKSCPIGELSVRGNSRERLYEALSSLTGLTAQFFIDLNLHGFVEMIDLLQKNNHSGNKPRPETLFDGNEMLLSLSDPSMPPAAKEEMLVQLLISACEIQFTQLGWKLLWLGYHNLKTDLCLDDLLEVRRITQGIAPTDVILMEILP